MLFKKLNKKLNISKNISIKRIKLNLKKEILYSNGSNNIAKKILAFNEKDSFEVNLNKTIKWQLKKIILVKNIEIFIIIFFISISLISIFFS